MKPWVVGDFVRYRHECEPVRPIEPHLGLAVDAGLGSVDLDYDLALAAGAALGLAKGGSVGSKLKSGGGVPGKAKIKGNSEKNDTVKALLSPGEGVIDRETMNDPGPAGRLARALMAHVQAKKGMKQ